MKIITAKNLRDNLDDIVKRVGQGESIKVTYRSKIAFVIQPDNSQISTPRPGSKLAMQKSIRLMQEADKIPKKFQFDPNKSIKELYHNILDNDPKYKGIN